MAKAGEKVIKMLKMVKLGCWENGNAVLAAQKLSWFNWILYQFIFTIIWICIINVYIKFCRLNQLKRGNLRWCYFFLLHCKSKMPNSYWYILRCRMDDRYSLNPSFTVNFGKLYLLCIQMQHYTIFAAVLRQEIVHHMSI